MDPQKTSRKRPKQKFICDFYKCERIFSTKYSLKRHMLVHNQKKKYKCKHCNKRFALPQYLKEHEFTHTNENPYVCGIDGCNQTFKQRGKLSVHRDKAHAAYEKKHYLKNALLNKQMS